MTHEETARLAKLGAMTPEHMTPEERGEKARLTRLAAMTPEQRGVWDKRREVADRWERANAARPKRSTPEEDGALAALESLLNGQCECPDLVAGLILEEAGWARLEREYRERGRDKSELRKEHGALLRYLTAARSRLENMSDDLAALLPVDVDELACAEAMAPVIEGLKTAETKMAPKPPKPSKKGEDEDKPLVVTSELALRVLRVLRAYHVGITATASADYGTASTAVRVLEIAGKAAGLKRACVRWRDIIGEVKEEVEQVDA